MSLVSKLFIKGMVCQRCIAAVQSELEAVGLKPYKVELGAVTVITGGEIVDTAILSQALGPLGFSLLEDKKLAVVRELKHLVAEVYSGEFDFPGNFRFSHLVRQRFAKDYDAVSGLFTLVEHKTLEQYVINYRIEKTKEFLVYTNMTLSDISFKLNYSSVAHLSRQFLQVTGLRPSHFREIRKNKERLELLSQS